MKALNFYSPSTELMARMAANIKPGITDKEFLELEIKKWLTSRERQRQIEGDKYYEGEQFIKVMPFGSEAEGNGFLAANEYSGRDDAQIFVTGNEERILVNARFDNLGKGASGAAVQCMNIVLGCEESKGLCL
mgnify:CR=1 FL=1